MQVYFTPPPLTFTSELFSYWYGRGCAAHTDFYKLFGMEKREFQKSVHFDVSLCLGLIQNRHYDDDDDPNACKWTMVPACLACSMFPNTLQVMILIQNIPSMADVSNLMTRFECLFSGICELHCFGYAC